MLPHPTIPLEEQVRGYWIASRILRGFPPSPDVRVVGADDARQCSVETLCVVGTVTRIPRLRARIMCDWPSLVPVQPPMPSLGAA